MELWGIIAIFAVGEMDRAAGVKFWGLGGG